MSDTNHITKEYLQSIFKYEDGNLYWKKSPFWSIEAGSKAGTLTKRGYTNIFIKRRTYKLHRLVYMFHYGYFPKCIDHIDGNPANNFIENLREATIAENQLNARLRINSKSKIKCVSWESKTEKWRVRMMVNGACKYFGEYKDLDYAKFIADAMRYKYHGKFARNA
jgi:hypothetical protein